MRWTVCLAFSNPGLNTNPGMSLRTPTAGKHTDATQTTPEPPDQTTRRTKTRSRTPMKTQLQWLITKRITQQMTSNPRRNQPPQSRKLNILQWNIQSLNSSSGNKTDDSQFGELFRLAGIFCLQETKGNVTLPGYRCFNKLRPNSKSGGICIGVERDLQTLESLSSPERMR